LKRPLLFLLADKDMQEACKGCFLERDDWARAFGCRKIEIVDTDLVVPAGMKDPGLFKHAHDIARPFLATHERLVVLLDSAWQGSRGRSAIEEELRKRLQQNGWSSDRCEVVAIEPELEAWAWSDRRALFEALSQDLREGDRHLWKATVEKETVVARLSDPEAELAKLRERHRIPASSAQFRRFAKFARIDRCADPAFVRLREALRRWFPPGIANGNGRPD
jgi:hypothetical protein